MHTHSHKTARPRAAAWDEQPRAHDHTHEPTGGGCGVVCWQVLAVTGVNTKDHAHLSHRRLEHTVRTLNNSGESGKALLVDYDELYESIEMHGQL